MITGPAFYAYRIRTDAPPVECLTGHPIMPGEVAVEPYRGRLISLCEPCAEEVRIALRELSEAEKTRKAG